ncbi:hypothetical protein D3C72_1646490 [compost metagenome]
MSRIAEADKIGAPRVAKEFSKCGMPLASRVLANVPASQRGRDTPSNARRRDGRKGNEKPVRTLFSRLAQTGISTVRTSVANPAAPIRSIKASRRVASPGRYAWNHVPGAAA